MLVWKGGAGGGGRRGGGGGGGGERMGEGKEGGLDAEADAPLCFLCCALQNIIIFLKQL